MGWWWCSFILVVLAHGAAAAPTPHSGRLLLQGTAPNASLPNWFNLPVCSKHGSHNTSVLRSLPRVQLGVLRFGPQDVGPRDFHPLSSVYVEPIVALALPGLVGWLIFTCSCCCFCYRRYRLGLCGEPIPTVKAYTPREVCVTMCAAVLSVVVLCLSSYLAVLVSYTSYEAAFRDALDAGYRAEDVMNGSLAAGGRLLEEALTMSASLDAFDAFVASQADIAALGAAAAVFPAANTTDGLFLELRRPQERYPQLIPGLTSALGALNLGVSRMPDLPLLSSRLGALNASIVNTSGVPRRIAASLVALNGTLHALPNLTLVHSRLGRVSDTQTGDTSHICKNIDPFTWTEDQITECDLLLEQLRLTRDTLLAADLEAPLSLFATYAALSSEFPPLPQVVDAMLTQRRELEAAPNLTKLDVDYASVEALSSRWEPAALAAAIDGVASSASALAAANAAALIPELSTLEASLAPLGCIDDVLTQLILVNRSLVVLPESVRAFFERGTALSTSLQAIPAPTDFITAIERLIAALSSLPHLPAYTAGVSSLSLAIDAMPSGASLLDALRALEATLDLPPSHATLANVSSTLHQRMAALPDTAPFTTTLSALNASRASLPSLLDSAITAIDLYDKYGDVTGMPTVEEARLAVQQLDATLSTRPDDSGLLEGLEAVDAELDRMPLTQPTVAQLETLSGAIGMLPDLAAYAGALDALLGAVEATPSVATLSATWAELQGALGQMPAFSTIEAPLSLYAAQQGLLPDPPTQLLDGTLELQSKLDAVPSLIGSGKAELRAAYDASVAQTATLRLGLFGEAGDGYFEELASMQPAVERGWWAFLSASFALPAVVSSLIVLSCLLRVGRPSLHAGQILMGLLPWYILLGLSIEVPVSLMLQDACDSVPWIAQRMSDFLEAEYGPQYGATAAPLQGWITGCPDGDPLATYFSPVVSVVGSAQSNATAPLLSLELRPDTASLVSGLQEEAAQIAGTATAVHDSMACRHMHGLYSEVRTAVCCDLAYALTAMWSVRLVATILICVAAVSGIAGYKRFRRTRDLWGPYASFEALEVGSYL
jgi:hypothetical protein